MKHINAKMMMCGLLAAIAGCPAYATDNGKKAVRVAVVENYGDYLTGSQDLSSKVLSFYDSNNVLLRKTELGLDGSQLKYYVYQYNEKGQLALTYSYLVSIQNNGLYGFATPTDSTTYKYDDKGRLVEQTGQEAFKYTYDDKGNLITKETLTKDWMTGDLSHASTITYSDFVAPNCPQRLVSTGIYDDYNYEGTLTYNSNFNLLCESDSTINADNSKTFKNSKVNTYAEDGSLKTVTRYQNQPVYDDITWEVTGYKVVPQDSIVYSADGDNRVKEETYTYNSWGEEGDNPWQKSLTFKVTEQREMDGDLSCGISVAPVEGKMNTNKITISIPEAAKNGYVFDLYRDGAKIATLQAGGDLSYTDEAVQNGNHDYFVQTVKADDLSTGYNSSDVTVFNDYTLLPAPTNVHGTGKKNVSVDGAEDGSCMTVAWDAPEYAEEMGFMGYNVMDHNEYSDGCINGETPNMKETSIDIDMFNYYTEKSIYVQAVYKLGYANSDTVTIKMDELPDITTTIKALANGGGSVAYANQTISVSKESRICVMDLSGKKLCDAKNATSLSLADLNQGVYIVSVECNGKVNLMKVRK